MSNNETALLALSDAERTTAIEDVCQLKYRWWDAVDTHDWDQVLALFAPDARVELGMKFPDGRGIHTPADFVEFCSTVYYVNKRALHLGHNPVVTVTSPTQAEAIWKFEAVEHPIRDGKPAPAATHVWGRHRDDYVKTAEGWRIAVTRLGGAVAIAAYPPIDL